MLCVVGVRAAVYITYIKDCDTHTNKRTLFFFIYKYIPDPAPPYFSLPSEIYPLMWNISRAGIRNYFLARIWIEIDGNGQTRQNNSFKPVKKTLLLFPILTGVRALMSILFCVNANIHVQISAQPFFFFNFSSSPFPPSNLCNNPVLFGPGNNNISGICKITMSRAFRKCLDFFLFAAL